MASTVGKLAFMIGANTGRFNRAVDRVEGRLKKLGRARGVRAVRAVARTALNATTAMSGLGVGLGAAAAAAVTFKRGMNMEEVSRSFASLSASIGSDSATMLGKLREATRGSVTDYDLMLASNNAMLLGVAKNDDAFASLAGKAMVLGQALGRGPVQSLNDITIGIGRQSRLILDNLGIIVKADQAYATYAASIGKTASQLTDAEKRQAFFNATLDSVEQKMTVLPKSVESARTAFGRLSTSIVNIIDKAMVPVVQAATPFVNKLAEKIKAIPIDVVAMALFKVFKFIAKAIAFIVDNAGLLVAIFSALKVIVGLIGTVVFRIAQGIVVVYSEVAQALGFEGSPETRAQLAELAEGAQQVLEQGWSSGIATLDDFFSGGTPAQDFAGSMLDEMETSLAKALKEGATGVAGTVAKTAAEKTENSISELKTIQQQALAAVAGQAAGSATAASKRVAGEAAKAAAQQRPRGLIETAFSMATEWWKEADHFWKLAEQAEQRGADHAAREFAMLAEHAEKQARMLDDFGPSSEAFYGALFADRLDEQQQGADAQKAGVAAQKETNALLGSQNQLLREVRDKVDSGAVAQ